VDLIHPHTKHDLADAVREAATHGTRLLVVGGRTHMDRGNRSDVDAELWTTMMDEVAAYEPAEMLAVVEAGMRVGELQAVLAEGGQEWPVDAPHDATVGGVIAAGRVIVPPAAARPRPRHRRGAGAGPGDGLLVKSGARTVKNVTGYDVHRLATGSLGTLGVIVQVALKLRPLPQVRRMLTIEGDGLELGGRVLETVPLPSAVIAERGRVRVWLEGWADEVEEQTEAARTVDPTLAVDHHPAPFDSARHRRADDRRGGGRSVADRGRGRRSR
jgi:glycolate oxidase FAD binding subunit